MSETPIFDSAYSECLDDTGAITRLEPLYAAFQKLERELNEAKAAYLELEKDEKEACEAMANFATKRDQWRECAQRLALCIRRLGETVNLYESEASALQRFDELEKGTK